MDLAQQNLYMLKRLTEKKSEYSVKKMEEDYKKVQNYKKIMCNFPCINFNKPKRGYSSDNKNFKKEITQYFPTINYINDGYLDKMGKKIKDKKKNGNKEMSEGKVEEIHKRKIDKIDKVEKVDKVETMEKVPKAEKKKEEKEEKEEKKENKMEKNLFNNQKISKCSDDKLIENKEMEDKNEINQKEEYEIDMEKEKIIDISRNETSSENEENI